MAPDRRPRRRLAVDGKLWLLRGDGEDLHAVHVAWLQVLEGLIDTLIDATTVPDHDTGGGGSGAPLGLSAGTVGRLRGHKVAVGVVRTREGRVMRS